MTWPIRKGDLNPPYRGQLCVKGSGLDLTGLTVQFVMVNADTGVQKVSAAAHIMSAADLTAAGIVTDDTNGWVEYAWQGTDTDTAAKYKAKWVVTDGTGKPRTWPPRGQLYIEVSDWP